MVASWGYPDQNGDTVNIAVPTDMVDTVGALLTDPDAFLASLREVEGALATMMIEVDSGMWVDPLRIEGAVEVSGVVGATRLLLRGGHAMVVDGEPNDVLLRIAEKVQQARQRLSDPTATVDSSATTGDSA